MQEAGVGRSETTTLIILPAFNEEGNVGRIVSALREQVEAAVLVIDDGSTDRTVDEAREAGAVVLSHPFNMGYGVALQTGYKYAARQGVSRILQLDADGQHEPACCLDLLRQLEESGSDVVIGSRHLGMGNYEAPFVRGIGMKFFAALTSAMLRKRFTDPTSGFQCFRSTALPFLVSDYFPVDYPDADVIVMLERNKLHVMEVPVIMTPSTGKSMHSGAAPIYYVFKMLLSMFVSLLRPVKDDGGPARLC